ncbi:MAG: hypothetical protein ACFFD2_17930 [Promethearchaeota archaeon]
MKEFQSKTTMLLIILIGLAFIGLGFTIGMYSFPEELTSMPALAGLPEPVEPSSIVGYLIHYLF